MPVTLQGTRVMWRSMVPALAGLAILPALAGCAGFPASYSPGQGNVSLAAAPVTGVAAKGTATLDVLTFNVEGLQWPARSGRARHLAQIGRVLHDLGARGQAPDVVLFQEVFSAAAIRAVKASGYPYMVGGPRRTFSSVDRAADAHREGRVRPTKGEIGFRFVGSGLVVASRWPITLTRRDAYSRKTCAGFDCLSNKGMVMVRVAIPGVPEPIDIIDTHMNSQKASKVRLERHLAAHRYQSEELALFINHYHTAGVPLVLGGDFNMRHSDARFAEFKSRIPFTLVHEYCAVPQRCDVRMSWDGDEPWMDTQDLQFYASGARVQVVPRRVEAMFDGSPGSPQLSDHDGFRVIYQLSWGASSTVSP